MLGEFSGALTVWSESLKRPSASESGDSGTTLGLFSTTGMVSLVMVHLGVAHLFFFLFFTSVLGGVTIAAEEGPAVAAFWGGPPPFEALMNFPPSVGRVAEEVGRKEELGSSTLGGLAAVGRPLASWLHIW